MFGTFQDEDAAHKAVHLHSGHRLSSSRGTLRAEAVPGTIHKQQSLLGGWRTDISPVYDVRTHSRTESSQKSRDGSLLRGATDRRYVERGTFSTQFPWSSLLWRALLLSWPFISSTTRTTQPTNQKAKNRLNHHWQTLQQQQQQQQQQQ